MSREAFEKWAKGNLDLQHIGVCYGDATTDAAFRAWQAAQAQQPVVPEGYVLVPIEPTRAMLDAAITLRCVWDQENE